MRTRRGKCYLGEEKVEQKKQSDLVGDRAVISRKRPKFAESMACDLLDSLPDDLVLSILAKLSSSASSPSDFISVLPTCKRFNELGLHSSVLSKASPKVFAVKADKWSESVHQFLKSCADAGNADACYTLGMIRFYCLANHGSGASFLAKAAIKSHAPALYSLAVIQFNGSGCFKNDKDLRAGVSLCARAAFLGHIDALRELGHCFQDGYGVRRNVVEGRRYLVQANAREFLAIPSSPVPRCPLLSEPVVHPVNRFLSKWFTNGCTVPGLGLRLCSHTGCGRSETRKHEFRRCSICGTVNYCSRACQALDWKVRHKTECAPLERVHLVNEEGRDGDENGGVGGGHDNYMLMQSHSNEV